MSRSPAELATNLAQLPNHRTEPDEGHRMRAIVDEGSAGTEAPALPLHRVGDLGQGLNWKLWMTGIASATKASNDAWSGASTSTRSVRPPPTSRKMSRW